MVGDGENARTEARTDAQVDACISTPSMGLGPTGPRDQHLQSFSGIHLSAGSTSDSPALLSSRLRYHLAALVPVGLSGDLGRTSAGDIVASSGRAGGPRQDEGDSVPPSTQGYVRISHAAFDDNAHIKSSKKLQFSLLNNQDTVKLAEFEVTHRDLYTPIDRLPVKNGVLDRRLVCLTRVSHVCRTDRGSRCREQQRKVRSARLVGCRRWIVLGTMRTSNSSFLSSTSASSSTQ